MGLQHACKPILPCSMLFKNHMLCRMECLNQSNRCWINSEVQRVLMTSGVESTREVTCYFYHKAVLEYAVWDVAHIRPQLIMGGRVTWPVWPAGARDRSRSPPLSRSSEEISCLWQRGETQTPGVTFKFRYGSQRTRKPRRKTSSGFRHRKHGN